MDDAARELAERAAGRLASAGQRAVCPRRRLGGREPPATRRLAPARGRSAAQAAASRPRAGSDPGRGRSTRHARRSCRSDRDRRRQPEIGCSRLAMSVIERGSRFRPMPDRGMRERGNAVTSRRFPTLEERQSDVPGLLRRICCSARSTSGQGARRRRRAVRAGRRPRAARRAIAAELQAFSLAGACTWPTANVRRGTGDRPHRRDRREPREHDRALPPSVYRPAVRHPATRCRAVRRRPRRLDARAATGTESSGTCSTGPSTAGNGAIVYMLAGDPGRGGRHTQRRPSRPSRHRRDGLRLHPARPPGAGALRAGAVRRSRRGDRALQGSAASDDIDAQVHWRRVQSEAARAARETSRGGNARARGARAPARHGHARRPRRRR